MKRGIITAANQNQEWLLPWWFSQVRKHTKLPLTIFDIGMSQDAKNWAQKNASLLSVKPGKYLVSKQEKIPPKFQKKWAQSYTGNVWEARDAWFQKPIACNATPHEETLWLDLDCELLCSPDQLFEFLSKHELAIAPEKKRNTYNSGVLAYRKSSSIIKKWKELIPSLSHQFMGDQCLLTHILKNNPQAFYKMPTRYNWQYSFGRNSDAAINHWVGHHGKREILSKMLTENFTIG